jgi:single-strand DNA-binding protein
MGWRIDHAVALTPTKRRPVMPALNVIMLVGHLTRDPEVRYSPTGTPVGALGLAVNTRVKGQDGQWREDPCFVDVVVFGNQAEACGEYLGRGDPALIEGRLQYRTWEDAHGNRRSKHEVVASRVQFIPKPGPRTVFEADPVPLTGPGTLPDASEDPQP